MGGIPERQIFSLKEKCLASHRKPITQRRGGNGSLVGANDSPPSLGPSCWPGAAAPVNTGTPQAGIPRYTTPCGLGDDGVVWETMFGAALLFAGLFSPQTQLHLGLADMWPNSKF